MIFIYTKCPMNSNKIVVQTIIDVKKQCFCGNFNAPILQMYEGIIAIALQI